MTLLLVLFLLYQSNKYAASLHIIESDDSDVSMINDAVYKVLQVCSKNDVNRVSVIQRSNPITPFIPYKWNLSITTIVYDYNSKNLVEDMETHPFNFHVIIFYELANEVFEGKWFKNLNFRLPLHGLKRLIIVTLDSESCSVNKIATYIALGTKNDNIIHICKNKMTQRVVTWAINSFTQSTPNGLFPGTEFNKNMGFGMRNMDTNIDTCNSVFHRKNLTHHNSQYIDPFNVIYYTFVKPYPPLMSIHNDGTIKESTIDRCDKIEIVKVTPKKWRIFGGFDGKVLATIFPIILRVPMVVNIYPEINKDNSSLIDWRRMRIYVTLRKSIILNSRDWMFLSETSTLAFIYPRVQREIRVITQSRGVVAVPARIRDIFNIKIMISMIIITGLFILAQRYFDGQSFGNAALDAYCLILGLGIPKLPNTLASRIFFSSLIFYFIILCTHFQGNVSLIMTVPLAASNIDSLDDLDASGYTVYAGYSTYENFESFRERFSNFKQHNGEHCSQLVLSDPKAACIDEAEYLHHEILNNHNLHVVKEPIKTFFSTYLVHGRWHLKNRFESLLTRLSEGGILHKWQRDIENSSRRKAQIRESISTDYTSSVSLENFKIFFILLYAGLLISAVVWIAEILYSRKNLIQSFMNFRNHWY